LNGFCGGRSGATVLSGGVHGCWGSHIDHTGENP
jgi:hypothetical protein